LAKWTFARKHLRRIKVLSNSKLQVALRKRRQVSSTLEFHSLANILTSAKMALYHPGCFFQKVLAVKNQRDLFTVAMSQVSYKEKRKKLPWFTKNWTSKVGLSRLPNNTQ
jgi:hypothetical protein